MSNDYAWLVSRGLCTRCRKAAARPGHVNCEACDVKRREAARAYANKRNADPEIRRKNRERAYETYAWKHKNGICSDCNNPASPGKARCETCLARNRERVRAYRLKHKDGGDAVCAEST